MTLASLFFCGKKKQNKAMAHTFKSTLNKKEKKRIKKTKKK